MSENNNRSGMGRPKPGMGLLFYGVLFVILIVFSSVMFGNQGFGSKKEATLSDVLEYIYDDSIKVTQVEIKGTTVTLEYAENGGSSQYVTRSIPYEYVDDLMDKLEEARNEGLIESYNYTEPFDWGLILNLISIVGLIVLVVVIYMNISKQSKDGNSVFSFGSNKAKLKSANEVDVKFSDVAGSIEEKEELSEIVDFLKDPQKYTKMGAKIPKGVLLHGVPGTGKTLLARAVAGEAGVPFFYISGSDFVEMLVGAGAARVRSLFSDAKKIAPSVIFIDEIDAVGRKRGAGLGGGNDEREQTLNQILVEMDGFDVHTNVIVIAATNRPDVLDPALLRPGRFDRQVMVNEPDVDEREDILKIHAKGKPLRKDVDLREIALSTVGFTGADLANLLNEAALLAARRNKKQITPLEISDATFRVMMGPEKNSKKLSDKVKKLTAYHEAGHAVVLRATSDVQKVDRVTIIPSGRAGGFTAYKPTEDLDFITEKMMLDQIKMSLGGRAAEELFLGEVSTGAASDLQTCNRIATNMIKKYGFSKKYRNMVFGDDNEEVFVGGSFGRVQSYSDETAAEIDKEIQSIIDECYEETKCILIDKKNIMEGLAERLIEKLKVDAPEFEEIYLSDGDLTAIRERDQKMLEEAEKEEKDLADKKAEKSSDKAEEGKAKEDAKAGEKAEETTESKDEVPSAESSASAEEAAESDEEGKKKEKGLFDFE